MTVPGDDLPADIRRDIERLHPADDLDAWLQRPIPALAGRSILEVHAADGDNEIRLYLRDAIGKFS